MTNVTPSIGGKKRESEARFAFAINKPNCEGDAVFQSLQTQKNNYRYTFLKNQTINIIILIINKLAVS